MELKIGEVSVVNVTRNYGENITMSEVSVANLPLGGEDISLKEVGDGWFELITHQMLMESRSGWSLVWDSIKAAISGREIVYYPQTYVLKILVKPTGKMAES